LVLSMAGAANAGPISKFDDRKPVADYLSTAPLNDVERCLVDMDGWLLPYVYRQPDRPDEVRLMWTDSNGLTSARVDLRREGRGTRIRIWMKARQALDCAPRNAK
jgi:hypothetical protein